MIYLNLVVYAFRRCLLGIGPSRYGNDELIECAYHFSYIAGADR